MMKLVKLSYFFNRVEQSQTCYEQKKPWRILDMGGWVERDECFNLWRREREERGWLLTFKATIFLEVPDVFIILLSTRTFSSFFFSS
jgi:hypothetical protein